MNPDTAVIGPVMGKGADLIPLPAPGPSVPAAPSLEQVREYVRASKAENTLRGYQSDWRDFCAWCECRSGVCPLPAAADLVAAYIAECAGPSEARQHSAEVERDRGGAQGGRSGLAHARGHRAQHAEGDSSDTRNGACTEGSRTNRRHPSNGRLHGRGLDRCAR